MSLPEIELERVKDLLGIFCETRTGDSARVEYRIRGNKVSVTESRPLFIDPSVLNTINVAQFEFHPELQVWVLYWFDRRDRRQAYPTGRNRDTLEKLVLELGNDPTGVFWE